MLCVSSPPCKEAVAGDCGGEEEGGEEGRESWRNSCPCGREREEEEVVEEEEEEEEEGVIWEWGLNDVIG